MTSSSTVEQTQKRKPKLFLFKTVLLLALAWETAVREVRMEVTFTWDLSLAILHQPLRRALRGYHEGASSCKFFANFLHW